MQGAAFLQEALKVTESLANVGIGSSFPKEDLKGSAYFTY